MPSPPRLAGSACRVVSRSFGGGLPVRAGIRFAWIHSSSGCNS